MRKTLLALAFSAALIAAARAQIWIMSPANQMSGKSAASAPGVGPLLLEDGVTPITLEDGVTPLCLEGGC